MNSSGQVNTAIHNRLQKNFRKLKPWAARIPTDCFRLYDRDIPEYPSLIDVYGDFVVLNDRRDFSIDVGPVKQKNFDDTCTAILEVLRIPPANLLLKQRKTFAHRDSGEDASAHQYAKNQTATFAGSGGGNGTPMPLTSAAGIDLRSLIVREGTARFRVNLLDYIDVGLFMDHRPLRLQFARELKPKSATEKLRMLNLFSYTSTVSVAAALAGAETTSIDLSNTYIEWSRENFKLNNLALQQHHFLATDVLAFLEEQTRVQIPSRYDVIFLDPPTFSNSKKMERDSFEIQRDQDFLVDACMKLLAPLGQLYFSNNRRDFKLSTHITQDYAVNTKTSWSLPQDFRDPKTHHLFVIQHK